MLSEILTSHVYIAPFKTSILKSFEAENGFCPPRCRGTMKVMDTGFWVEAFMGGYLSAPDRYVDSSASNTVKVDI